MDYKDKIFILAIENKFRTKYFEYIGYNVIRENNEEVYFVIFKLYLDKSNGFIEKTIKVKPELFKKLTRNYSLKTLTDDSES